MRGLRRERDRALVPDDPAVIVDAADRVARVARLDVEQVLAQRARQRAGVVEQQQRAVGAAGRQRRRRGGVERALGVGEDEPVAGVDDPPAEAPVAQRAKAIALSTGSGPEIARDRAELRRAPLDAPRRRSPTRGPST